MLQNSRVTAFTVFQLLRENQLGEGGGKITPRPTPPRLGLTSELRTIFKIKFKNLFPNTQVFIGQNQ